MAKKAISFDELISSLRIKKKENALENKPSGEKKNKFKARFAFDLLLNRPIFKIFSDYFNILKDNKELQATHELKVVGMVRDNEFRDNINLYDNFGEKHIFLDYNGLIVKCTFDYYKQNNEVQFFFSMSSNEKTFIDSEFFYEKIWSHAVDISDLKGSYFVMERDEILWTTKKLEKRAFSDIYLPQSTVDDLKLYVATSSQIGRLMRYLMVGNPGTGKTESTLVLANELNKLGVTIIKTPVCSMIKEKVQLASLLAPSLIIFDDIDLSLGSRKHGVHSERLQDFLDVLDGTDKVRKDVGMVATTNSVALLDLAAQRPGRFDKVLSFDELTHENVKNIILKSLRFNFKVKPNSEVANIFSDQKIVRLFHENRVTGAHIYNSVYMLKLRNDLLQKEVTVESLIEDIKKEINVNDKIRKADYLSEKLNSERRAIGLGANEEEEDYEEGFGYPDDDIDEEEEKRQRRRRK